MQGTENQLILARLYVEWSNQHDLNAIITLFDEKATYCSSNVGSYEGKEAIGEMMGGFFERFSDVSWEARSFMPIHDNTIEFTFTMRGSNIHTGEHIQHLGLERITFTDGDLISHIEVIAQIA